MKTLHRKKCLLALFPVLVFFADAKSQRVTVYDSFAQLESRLKNPGDTTLLVNFWATWCKPCIQELPYFQSLDKKYAGKKVKILLVSLDFKSQLDSVLIPFIINRDITPEVVLLADANENAWLSKLDNEWDGAIPATFLITKNKKLFFGKAFESQTELEQWVATLINFN